MYVVCENLFKAQSVTLNFIYFILFSLFDWRRESHILSYLLMNIDFFSLWYWTRECVAEDHLPVTSSE